FFIFIIFTIFIGLPILLAEFLIGRGSQKDAVSAYAFFAPRSGWPAIGILGMITCFILLSFYSVVGGWILFFIFETIVGSDFVLLLSFVYCFFTALSVDGYYYLFMKPL